MVILLLLASLPSEFKEVNRAQTKGNLPFFHEIEARLLDEELMLKLEAKNDEVSKALYLKRGHNRSSKNSGSKSTQAKFDQKGKNNIREAGFGSFGSNQSGNNFVKPKQNQRGKDQSTHCSYCKDVTCNGLYSEDQCELKKSVDQMKTLDMKIK